MALDQTKTNGHAAAPPRPTVLFDKNLILYNEFIMEVMAKIVAHLQDEFDDKLAIIKSKQQSDITELQSSRKELKKQFNAKLAAQERKHNLEIAKLKDKKAAATQPISWKLDCTRFRAIPFYSDGKPGVAINLRPLFAQYNDEVNS